MRPEYKSDISTTALSPCEEIDDVSVYEICVDKELNTDKMFQPNRFRKSLIRCLKRMERMNELSTASPYGYINGDDELCSILVMSVDDCGDYVSIKVARADEKSYALFKKENAKHIDDTGVIDPDF